MSALRPAALRLDRDAAGPGGRRGRHAARRPSAVPARDRPLRALRGRAGARTDDRPRGRMGGDRPVERVGGRRDRGSQPRQRPGGPRGRGLGGDRPRPGQPAADAAQPRAARRAHRPRDRIRANAGLRACPGMDAADDAQRPHVSPELRPRGPGGPAAARQRPRALRVRRRRRGHGARGPPGRAGIGAARADRRDRPPRRRDGRHPASRGDEPSATRSPDARGASRTAAPASAASAGR